MPVYLFFLIFKIKFFNHIRKHYLNNCQKKGIEVNKENKIKNESPKDSTENKNQSELKKGPLKGPFKKGEPSRYPQEAFCLGAPAICGYCEKEERYIIDVKEWHDVNKDTHLTHEECVLKYCEKNNVKFDYDDLQNRQSFYFSSLY